MMKTIVWDVDDVLNSLMKEWLQRAWQVEHPDSAVTYDGITSNPPHELLGVSKEHYLQSLDKFRMEQFATLEPNPKILGWFRENGHKARHIVLTAVPLSTAHLSAAWVMSNFGNWVRSFNVVPSFRPDSAVLLPAESKAEFLRSFSKVDVFIDDSTDVIESIREMGLQAIQMPRPWNHLRGDESTVLEQLDCVCG